MTDIRAAFEAAYGRPADGVWSSPGRVNLIGEHTDYNNGFVLPFGIDRRTWAAVAVRDDREIHLRSTFADGEVVGDLDALTLDSMSGWSAYVLGVAWAMADAGIDLSGARGLDVLIDSDVPVGAGLGSSAALECAAGAAFNEPVGPGTGQD
ncbi:hypothetical protein GCM10025876_15590 [Demequina litorisediminis]|uniref:Galactokinase n=1 Tax=Demequina litorisediminis TaxID=1849022 RepID=A0ABQ6IDC8_9MICO|nr:hypothetical protein GCM10025876_15590 [Demequina litorisediminis]